MTKKTAPKQSAGRPRPPLPRGYDKLPPKPSFGWLGNPADLTLDELDEIIREAGMNTDEMQRTTLLAYAAVAYARRQNPALYPWSTAKALRISDIDIHDFDEDEDQAHADALQAAMDSGEPMADPGSPD
jgi:hypothetical protein